MFYTQHRSCRDAPLITVELCSLRIVERNRLLVFHFDVPYKVKEEVDKRQTEGHDYVIRDVGNSAQK